MPTIKTLYFGTDFEGDVSVLPQMCVNTTSADGKGLHLLCNGCPLTDDISCVNWDDLALTLDEGCHFVFGGDSTDHKVGDLTILRLLIDLKHRYPDRVTLIAGNRDLNKIRLVQEMNEPYMDYLMNAIGDTEPRWLAKGKRTSIAQFVKESVDTEWYKAIFNHEKKVDVETAWPSLSLSEKQMIYLHWLMCRQLNSAKTFDNRRKELKHRGKPCSSIWDVLGSFMGEELILRKQYAKACELAVSIGNLTFVHGGISPETFITCLLSAKHSFGVLQIEHLGLADWLILEKNERKVVVSKFLETLKGYDEFSAIALRDWAFKQMNDQLNNTIEKEFVPLAPGQILDPLHPGLIAQGYINRQTMPTDFGFVGYNHINGQGDSNFDEAWLSFLHKAHCWDNASGHIPQGNHGRLVCQKVRFALIDTTFKEAQGLPNEDILRIEFEEDGGHSLQCINQEEVHTYPRMSSIGHYEFDWTEDPFVSLTLEHIPKKYHQKENILELPWSIGPYIIRGSEEGYLCTQKHGIKGQYRTFTTIVSEAVIVLQREKKTEKH